MNYINHSKHRFTFVTLLTDETCVYGVPVKAWDQCFTGNIGDRLRELKQQIAVEEEKNDRGNSV
jgi:hypothetical protein